MPSRLSSLLVRDGLVGVKRMEKAFQRQVIYGGSLDTILLEMTLVPEERLTQYLALASGLPPAARDEGASIDPAAVALISREVAEQYRAVPVALEGEAIRILVCAPLEITELEDLADQIDRPLQPLITPEYRWHLAFASAYGLEPPARYTTLARAIDVDPIAPPVGRAKTVIVEDLPRSDSAPIPVATDATERTPAPKHVGPADTIRIESLAAEPVVPAATPARDLATAPTVAQPSTGGLATAPTEPHDARSKSSTLVGIRPVRAATDVGESIPPRKPAARDGVPDEAVHAPRVSFKGTDSTGVPMAIVDPKPRSVSDVRGMVPLKRPPTAPITTEGRDSPLNVVRARELLATAEDRDTVFLTLLRATRNRARWAGLLTIQGGAAIGRVALADPELDTTAVNTVLIPLDVVSPFRSVVTTHQPHIGPLTTNDPSIDSMLLRFGGTLPPSALIMPIVLRDRVIAVVVAHRLHMDIRLVDVTEILPMATAASDALGRLIVKHKAAGYRAPTDAPSIEIEPDEIATKKLARPGSASPWAAPSEPAAPVTGIDTVELQVDAPPPRPMDQVLDDIERAKEGQAEDAMNEAVERAPEALAALVRRFPGRLRIDRLAVTGRPLRAAQYGGLPELVVRLGAVASELLIEKMSAPQRDVRFYATVCATELRPRNAVFALAERLFDQDFGVRACAIEALAGYPLKELGHALVRARRAVHSNDPEIVGAATAAIRELGDIEAIPDLIAAIERGDRAGEHARKTLVALTAQDFGTSERKWRKWHEGARNRHRVEWLIDGLTHKEDLIRELAINDLRRLTGEYFGYHHDLPRKERESAADRWAAWWREQGQRRFTAADDESQRPTGRLPARKGE